MEHGADMFPPGKSGGLIEAWLRPRCPEKPIVSGFRRVNPAASLKPAIFRA